MRLAHWIQALTLGLVLSAAQALAQGQAAQHDMAMHGPSPGADRDMADRDMADRDMMAGMEKMNHDMSSAPMTGNPDHDFVAMMIPHHQGAVDMARIELRDGKDPSLRQLAKDIIAAQDREIAMMQRWLAAHSGH